MPAMGVKIAPVFQFKAIVVLIFLSFATSVHAEVRRAETDKFVIYAEAPEEIVTAYARNLERFDSLLRHFTGIDPEPSPIKFTIYLVSSERDIQRRMGGGGYIGGIYRRHARPLRTGAGLQFADGAS